MGGGDCLPHAVWERRRQGVQCTPHQSIPSNEALIANRLVSYESTHVSIVKLELS